MDRIDQYKDFPIKPGELDKAMYELAESLVREPVTNPHVRLPIVNRDYTQIRAIYEHHVAERLTYDLMDHDPAAVYITPHRKLAEWWANANKPTEDGYSPIYSRPRSVGEWLIVFDKCGSSISDATFRRMRKDGRIRVNPDRKLGGVSIDMRDLPDEYDDEIPRYTVSIGH